MKKGFLIILSVLLFNGNLFSQAYNPFEKNKVDSLLQLLPAKTGKDRTDVLNQLGWLHLRNYPKECIMFTKEALQLANKQSYRIGEARANVILGTVNYYQNTYAHSIRYLLSGYKILKELKPTEELARCSYLLSIALYMSGIDEPHGVDYMQESINIFRELNMKYEEGMAKLHLSVAMRWEERYKEALQLNASACSVLVGENFGRSIDKGIAIACRGDIARDTGNHRAAINYYLLGASYYDTTRIEDLALKAQSLGTLGWDYMNYGKSDSALYYYNKSLEIAKSIGNIYSTPSQFSRIAENAISQGNTKLGIVNYDSALFYLDIADSLGHYYLDKKYQYYVSYSFELYHPAPIPERRNNLRLRKINIYNALSSIYRTKKKFEKVLELHEKMDIIKDSINRFNRNTEVKDIAARYETEQKDQQIVLLSKENEVRNLQLKQSRYLLFGLAGMVILVIIIALLYIRQNRYKTQQQNMQLQQRLFRSQMNPHFIFNSLASIQNTIINEQPEKASKYLARFAKLVRNILDNSSSELITLEEEINTIENYLELQKVRFPEKFEYKIEVDKKIEQGDVYIPPMLAQPFIENAIEHGIKNRRSSGNIHIRLILVQDKVIYEIKDDGIGRQKAREVLQEHDSDHKSLATRIIMERIKIFNNKIKKKIKLEIIDLNDKDGNATGTQVIFEIPV